MGDALISEGDRAQELVVLHQGLVKVTAQLDGGRVLLMDMRIAGDVVGELAAMDLGPRSATVTACGEVVATVVPQHELRPFLLAHPEVSLALNRVLCGRLRRSDRWRLEFGGYPVLVRLARVLVELAVTYGRQERKSVRIDVNLSQSEFAALTGSTTNTVHKALAQLRKDGLVITGIRRTYVRDLARLRMVARLSVPPPSFTATKPY
ncbi:Crp/Fnr family transcriptional regulator [Streptomyces sp. NPDC053560]|uniref:Crp/Fnr family transcriptional regulator n=1 Tax=Streptomyces sp. NPDC053560 TaxID=3365711 RepID=UPI0037D5A83E